MKKFILILLASSCMFGKLYSAAGVYVENRTGQDIYAQIDYGTTVDWKEIKEMEVPYIYKRTERTFLPSEGSNILKATPRKIYFKIDEGNKKFSYYETDQYNYPDQITIIKTTKNNKPTYNYIIKTTTKTYPAKQLTEVNISDLSKKIKLSQKPKKRNFAQETKDAINKINAEESIEKLQEWLTLQEKLLKPEAKKTATKEEIKHEENIKKVIEKRLDFVEDFLEPLRKASEREDKKTSYKK